MIRIVSTQGLDAVVCAPFAPSCCATRGQRSKCPYRPGKVSRVRRSGQISQIDHIHLMAISAASWLPQSEMPSGQKNAPTTHCGKAVKSTLRRATDHSQS